MNMAQQKQIFMTSVGYENLLTRLEEKQKEYEQVCDHRQVAFEMSGDGWHDNPEFNRMQQMEANLNHTIKTLTDRLEEMKFIEIQDDMRNCDAVSVGSIVHLRRYDLDNDHEIDETWEIRGFDETDIAQKHLAYNSPLASQVMALHVGDVAESVQVGSRCFDLEVIQLFPTRKTAGLDV